jgi:hypothetical protein
MMKLEPEHYSNPTGWAIVLYGALLSFVSAFIPFFSAGYYFQLDLLLAGFAPYLVYGIAVPLLPGKLTATVGIVVAVAHTGLVVAVRLLGAGEALMMSVPAILAILVIPLVVMALVKTSFHKPGRRLIRH